MNLAFRLDGPEGAPALVLSPSLGTTTSLWEPQLPAFAERRRVVRHDHPGHGDSPPPDGPVTVESMARAVLALLDELGIERASFCGISLGGMVGMWLGANAPERIDRLVLCCTGAKLGSRADYEARAELVRRDGTAVTVPGARERWFTPATRESGLARRLLVELAGISSEGYASCCEAVAAWDFRHELERIASPTLALFGGDDPVTTPGVRRELARIPGSRSVSIDGASHLANVDRPEAFTAAVLAQLDERRAT